MKYLDRHQLKVLVPMVILQMHVYIGIVFHSLEGRLLGRLSLQHWEFFSLSLSVFYAFGFKPIFVAVAHW